MFIILVQIHREAVLVKIMNCGLFKLSILIFWSRTKDGGKISTVHYAGMNKQVYIYFTLIFIIEF